VLKNVAPSGLIESYNAERVHGADENILNSARATSFMTPKSSTERLFRDEVLALASTHPFARQLVNSGRLSRPCSLAGFALGTADTVDIGGAMVPGAPCLDAPVRDRHGRDGWLLDHLGGDFVALGFGDLPPTPDGVRRLSVGAAGDLGDPHGLVAARYGGTPGVVYLIRPDQHVAARFVKPSSAAIADALGRANAHGAAHDR
jgi:3-(3-hydroxy-phenyl)propionate hydroxylase